MNKLFGRKMLIASGIILIALGLILAFLVFTNSGSFSEASVTDYKWESAVSILVGLYFLIKGLKKWK
jgi:uncharacterized membrane protein